MKSQLASRVIRRDKNTLITLNAPLEITQKQPLAMRNFEFSGRQPTTHLRHSAMDLSFPIPVIEIQTQKYRSEPYIILLPSMS
jgi:hypothetical protein